MAQRAITITPQWPGRISAALILLLTLGTLLAVGLRAEWLAGPSPADCSAIRFTVSQAIVSATMSVVLAIPLARALARRRFRGRALLISLLGAPFLLPVIVAVLGLLAVFGRSGVVNDLLATMGLPTMSIYGFHGVVLAHVFFNLPLATRLLLQGWLSIPAERFRLTASLDASVWSLLERPMLQRIVPGIFLVIFLICLTSFAVALTLGGGPRATTIELAVYQALRFDFDLGRAAFLAGIQFAICALAAVIAWKLTPLTSLSGGMDRVVDRFDLPHPFGDGVIIGALALFLLLPLGLVLACGVPGLVDLPASIWLAAGRSVVVSVTATLLCLAMALALGLWRGPVAQIAGLLPLAASGLVIGTGAFIALQLSLIHI